jgi:hypothetical protein
MHRSSSGPRAVVSLADAGLVKQAAANDNGKPWRCRACGSLLGIERGRELHVKYKEADLWIVGTCRRLCRQCGAANEITVGTTREES